MGEKVFCRLMQNLYSSTGKTPIKEQAKKPFRTLIAVVFIVALPFWYSIAVSNTATTVPAIKSAQPNRVNSCMVAFIQSRSKCRRPYFHHGEEVCYCAVDCLIKPLEHCVPDHIGYLLSEKVKHSAYGITDSGKNIS